MNMPPTPDDFREQLSAWHDGELGAEPSRFVMRRLAGDAALRDSVVRWQRIGDAMRGHAQAEVRSGLAERVAAAIERDGVERVPLERGAAPAVTAPTRRAVRRLPWLASAAAVGVAAVLWWSPDATEPGQVDARPAFAGVAVPRDAAPVQALPRAPRPAQPPLAPAPREALVAVAPVHDVPELVRAPQPTAEQLAPLPAIDAPSRPWPRSAQADGAFVVDYDVEASGRR